MNITAFNGSIRIKHSSHVLNVWIGVQDGKLIPTGSVGRWPGREAITNLSDAELKPVLNKLQSETTSRVTYQAIRKALLEAESLASRPISRPGQGKKIR